MELFAPQPTSDNNPNGNGIIDNTWVAAPDTSAGNPLGTALTNDNQVNVSFYSSPMIDLTSVENWAD